MIEKKVETLESKVVDLHVGQSQTKMQLETLAENSNENTVRLGQLHTTVTDIDKKLSVIVERLGNSLDNVDRVELSQQNDQSENEVRMGGIEDRLSEITDQISTLDSRVAVESKRTDIFEVVFGKSSDRKWSAVTLIPYALITALVSGSVTYLFSAMKDQNVAIKQTQIDKLQKQLNDLLKIKERDFKTLPTPPKA